MKKEVIGEASTVEEAKERASALLGAPASADVKFEIVAMPQKKLLGLFGGSPAKVKASYDDGKKEPKPTVQTKAAPKPEKKVAPAQKQEKTQPPVKAQNRPAPTEKQPVKTEKPAPKAKSVTQPQEKKKSGSACPSDEISAAAAAYLAELLKGLKVEGAAVTANQGDNGLSLEISCEDYGIIIGRRGETLDSIQYLVSLLVNKGASDYIRVTINVGNYREKREETLRNLAKKNSSHVLRSGRRVVLEPMNPYERRIIHTAVQEIEGVVSRSVGSNNERKVVIELAEGVKPTGGYKEREEHRGGGRSGHGGYNRNRSDSRQPAAPAAPARKLAKEELPKFGKIQ